MKRGKISEKRFKMTLNRYKELGYKFLEIRLDDISSANQHIAGDYLVSHDGLLHSIEIKHISMSRENPKLGFKNFYKRDQILRLIAFSDACLNHRSWYLIIFWSESMLNSFAYFIPAKVILEVTQSYHRKSFNTANMEELFKIYRLSVFENKYLLLNAIFNDENDMKIIKFNYPFVSSVIGVDKIV